jgi:hypothetical protein
MANSVSVCAAVQPFKRIDENRADRSLTPARLVGWDRRANAHGRARDRRARKPAAQLPRSSCPQPIPNVRLLMVVAP